MDIYSPNCYTVFKKFDRKMPSAYQSENRFTPPLQLEAVNRNNNTEKKYWNPVSHIHLTLHRQIIANFDRCKNGETFTSSLQNFTSKPEEFYSNDMEEQRDKCLIAIVSNGE